MTPSWDLFIMIFFIAVTAYGFLMQRDKTVVTMISIYVALIVTTVLSDPVQGFFAGEKAIMNQVFIRSSANSFTIQSIIFLLTIGLVSTKSGIEGRDSGGSVIEMFGFSFLNAALMTSSLLFFMDPAKREAIVASSKLANILVSYQVWWMILPVVLLIATGFMRKGN